MSRDDAPIDDFDCVLTVDDGQEENETIFVVFYTSQYGSEIFCRAFYTHEKAQKYADKMSELFNYGSYIVREEDII